MRFAAINTNTYRYRHTNYLRNLTSLKLGNFNFKLTK